MRFASNWLLISLLLLSFIIRLLPVDFPNLTGEEARISYRGYTLAKYGTDELGRRFPLIFNGLDDYHLPAVSYITMIGVMLFGKTDLGVRIPFVLIGTLVVFLTFAVAKFFDAGFLFRIISAFLVASSPALIFSSKTPNETIVLVFIFMLLFYLLVNSKNLWLIILTMLAATLTSKLAWFILLPFTFYIIWLFKLRRGILILSLGVVITTLAVLPFLTIPQAKRSLLENNFPIFSNSTIKNGIDTLRGQGMKEGWPDIVSRLLFNKSHFLFVGLLHWLSHFNPTIYFGQFDPNGKMGYSYLGGWVKFLLIPFILGLVTIFKKGDRKLKLILVLFLIFTYPTFFIYPKVSIEAITLIFPFMAIIIAFGFVQIMEFSKKAALLGIFLIIFELAINICNISPEFKSTNWIRPSWVEAPILDIVNFSKDNKTAISDDIIFDISPFIYWYSPFDLANNHLIDMDFPYKLRQTRIGKILIVGSENNFYNCALDEPTSILASKRDLAKVKKWLNLTYEMAVKKNIRIILITTQHIFLIQPYA